MELTTAKEMLEFEDNANMEIACWNLPYSFEWSNGKTIFGFCNTRTKEITVSLAVFKKDISEAWATLKHELAHAYNKEVFNGHGHDYTWKKSCMIIGVLPKRCHDDKPILSMESHANYKAVCKNCGKIVYGFRKRRTETACRKCCNIYNFGNYDYRFKLVFEKIN